MGTGEVNEKPELAVRMKSWMFSGEE